MVESKTEDSKDSHHEEDNEHYQRYRKQTGNENPREKHGHELPGIGNVSTTGVIYCTDRATELGYKADDERWANFGQGAPETGHLPGAPDKPTTIEVTDAMREYAPTAGLTELRTAVANLYNDLYRKDKSSQYSWENVCIVPGGRAGLVRVAAMLSESFLGFFVPDYTAYTDVLSLFKGFVSIPGILEEEDAYKIHPDLVRNEIKRGISVILTSNPRNPTGQMVRDEELKEVMDICRGHATLIMDEFYSGYNYTSNCDGSTNSSAAYVEDVNEDGIVIIDGLTKTLRLPGWRVCWVVGPKRMIKGLASSGSFLDGGASHPLQCAAIPLLEPKRYRQDVIALQKHFMKKRDYVLDRLAKMGLKIHVPPEATFYIWLDLSKLPKGIRDGMSFFEECLQEKVIVVPGVFFDINPSHRRNLAASSCHHFVRLSFGPAMDHLVKGLDGIERVLRKHEHDMNEVEHGPSATQRRDAKMQGKSTYK